jgi:hypothetical protein
MFGFLSPEAVGLEDFKKKRPPDEPAGAKTGLPRGQEAHTRVADLKF